jgi:predicted ABC-type sugar transport system permease subunit
MAKNKPADKNIPQTKPIQSAAKPVAKSSKSSTFSMPKSQNGALLFDKINYAIMAAGSFLIVLGFILMSGGNTDPNVFNEAEIYSFRRITLAPILVIAGFIFIIVAILKKPATVTN